MCAVTIQHDHRQLSMAWKAKLGPVELQGWLSDAFGSGHVATTPEACRVHDRVRRKVSLGRAFLQKGVKQFCDWRGPRFVSRFCSSDGRRARRQGIRLLVCGDAGYSGRAVCLL